MSIERAEQLKKELTDQWVVVNSGIPELRRFQELTGRVKTVNMNCRALVEFDGPEDIGWYDIDPGALTVVDGPKPKEKPTAEQKAKAAPAAKSAPKAAGGSPMDQIRAQAGGAKPAAAKPTGGSPLDQIRAGGAGAKPAAAPAKPATGGSPLDQIRAQSAGGSAAPEAPAEEPAAPDPATAEPAEETPPPAPPAAGTVDTSGMSPLDAIRAQGAFKGDK